jgi:hypothetical protein
MISTISKKSERAKKIEELAVSSIPLLSEVEHNMKQNSKRTIGGKGKVNNENRCNCAKAFQQKGTAYEAFLKGDPVYLMEYTLENGKKKTIAYSYCSFSHLEGSTFCSRHTKQDSNNRILYDSIVNRTGDGTVRQVTSVQDRFFDGMGTRGAKKKTNEGSYYDFDCIDHPILRVLRHPNKQMNIWLVQCAMELLQSNRPIVTANNSNSSSTYIISQGNAAAKAAPSLTDLMADDADDVEEVKEIPVKRSPPPLTKPKAIEVFAPPPTPIEESESDASDNDSDASSDVSDDETSDDETSDDETSDDEEEATEVVEITTNKGASYALNPVNMEVYDIDTLEDDDGPTVVGKLIEVSESYANIEHDDKSYTICKKFTENDTSFYLCILTDRVFDMNMNYVGKLKVKKSGEKYISKSKKE